MHTCDGFNIYYHLVVHKVHKMTILFIYTVFKGMVIMDSIKSMEVLERIAIISKLCTVENCTSIEKDIVLSLINELAEVGVKYLIDNNQLKENFYN